MTPLYQYVLEGYGTIRDLKIDFDLFKRFIQYWVEDDEGFNLELKNKDAVDTYIELSDAISGRFRDSKPVIKALYKFCSEFAWRVAECGVEMSDEIIRLLYERVCDMPLTKATNMLGMGEEGIVIELKDKVIKMFFKDQIPQHALAFYKVCQRGDIKVFPKVYRIGKGYVVMEKLKLGTKKCKFYQKFIDDYYWQIYDKNYDINDFTAAEQEVIHWLEEIRSHISQITQFNDFGDLDEKNFGERADGTIVYFDI